MAEQRNSILSRTYTKASDTHMLCIVRVSGENISGAVFQYEIWLNNQEQVENRITSGNKYDVRRAFISKLLDLQEDGWSRVACATYENPLFFDPGGL